jgi:hypothetical protein
VYLGACELWFGLDEVVDVAEGEGAVGEET